LNQVVPFLPPRPLTTDDLAEINEVVGADEPGGDRLADIAGDFDGGEAAST
jgi:hypothetical protein